MIRSHRLAFVPSVLSLLPVVALLAVAMTSQKATFAQALIQTQSVTQQQLQSLVPSEQDLQGFTRIRPEGELPEGWSPRIWSPQTHEWVHPISPAVQVDDDIEQNGNLAENTHGLRQGTVSEIRRTFYSQNGMYRLEIRLRLSASRDAAGNLTADLPLRQVFPSQAVPKSGTFSSPVPIGDESWVFPMTGSSSAIMFRCGKVMAFISGDLSNVAARSGISSKFPPAAVEAAAYQILLRLSRQAKLTGVSTQAAHVAVNGKPLVTDALMASSQVYVPVAEFAKAMGMQSQWDAKTGALTLTRTKQKPITLTAGSMVGKVGTTAVALQTPVLKEAGQPVMTLQDLLMLVKGRVVSQKGSTFQVKA